jgi:hypothetical protein
VEDGGYEARGLKTDAHLVPTPALVQYTTQF